MRAVYGTLKGYSLILLPIPLFLSGLAVSVGGLTERLVKFSSTALFSELQSAHFSESPSELSSFASDLVAVLASFHKVDRVVIPFFKFLDQLLTSGTLDTVLEDEGDPFAPRLLETVKAELAKCGDPTKLLLRDGEGPTDRPPGAVQCSATTLSIWKKIVSFLSTLHLLY